MSRPSISNLRALLSSALPQDIDEGMNFYPTAHTWCVALAALGAPSTDHAAGIYAALSPKNDWDHNLGDCFEVVRKGKNAKCSTTGVNLRKAVRIAAGESPLDVLRGPKVTDFYHAIARPSDTSHIPVDRHLIRAAHGQHNGETWLSRQGAREYQVIRSLYAQLGTESGLGNRAAAIVWFVQRRLRLGEVSLPLSETRYHCGRPMHLHGWDRQTSTPRRRWRCPTCRRVIVEHPTRNPNGARGQVYVDERGRERVYLGREHPLANSAGWQYTYRVAVAEAIGRVLRTDEHVHHRNGDHTDDNLLNLELLAAWYHGRLSGYAAVLAVARGEDGKFKELESPQGPFAWPRRAAVLGNAARDAARDAASRQRP